MKASDPLVAVTQDDFWSHSWLGFGVDSVKDKVFDYLYDEFVYDSLLKKPHESNHEETDETFSPEVPYEVKLEIPNPCGHPGCVSLPYYYYLQHLNLLSFFKTHVYTNSHDMEYNDQVVMKGTGEGEKCIEVIKNVVWPNPSPEHECAPGKACPISGVQHPPVSDMRFYAMSVYYYAFDCIRALGPVSIDASWWVACDIFNRDFPIKLSSLFLCQQAKPNASGAGEGFVGVLLHAVE
jgi:hypothetical protein